jgi:hypothetical protein
MRKTTANNIFVNMDKNLKRDATPLNSIKNALKSNQDGLNWDLIELDAAVAISLGDNKEYRKIQKHLRHTLSKHKGDAPEGLLMIASEDMKSLLNKVGQ